MQLRFRTSYRRDLTRSRRLRLAPPTRSCWKPDSRAIGIIWVLRGSFTDHARPCEKPQPAGWGSFTPAYLKGDGFALAIPQPSGWGLQRAGATLPLRPLSTGVQAK